MASSDPNTLAFDTTYAGYFHNPNPNPNPYPYPYPNPNPYPNPIRFKV